MASWLLPDRSSVNSEWPPAVLRADSASAGMSISLATGRLNDEIEALYLLDHETLTLSCYLFDARLRRQPIGVYRADLRQAFPAAVQGNMDLVMVTGLLFGNVAGRTGPMRLAESLCYVADGKSGMLAAFNVPFNQTGLQNAVDQSGNMNLVWQGLFRDPRLLQQQPQNPAGGQNKDQDAGKGGN